MSFFSDFFYEFWWRLYEDDEEVDGVEDDMKMM